MALPPKQWEPAELRRMLSETTNEAAAVVLHCESKAVAGLRARHEIPIPWKQRGSRFFDQVRKVAVERWKDYPARKPEHLTLQELEVIITERMKPTEPEVTKPQRLDPAGVVEAVRRYIETHAKAPTDEDIARENGWDPDRVHRILFHQRHVILRNHDSGTYYLADELWDGNKPSEMEGENVAKPRKLPPDEQLLKEVEEIKATGGPVERTLMERYGVSRGAVSTAVHRARVNLQRKPVEAPKVQVITVEEPEADIKANGETPAGTSEQAEPESVEPAKAQEVDLSPRDEWRQATTSEETHHREVLSSNLPSISDPVFVPVHQQLTQKFEAELWRRVRQDVIDILAEELPDDATFGRVVRRLRQIRVGVA